MTLRFNVMEVPAVTVIAVKVIVFLLEGRMLAPAQYAELIKWEIKEIFHLPKQNRYMLNTIK